MTMPLVLSETLYHQIRDHLENAFPNEGGGFLVGTVENGQQTVTEIHPVQNVFASEEQFHRFLAEDGAFWRIEDEADAKGLSLLGYFHSHPDSPPVPSEYDRVHALRSFSYLIVSVMAGKADTVRLWQLVDDRSRFDEVDLIFQ